MLVFIIISLFACGLYAADSATPDEKFAAALKLSCSPPLAVPSSPYRCDRVKLTMPSHIIEMQKNSVIKEIQRGKDKSDAQQKDCEKTSREKYKKEYTPEDGIFDIDL